MSRFLLGIFLAIIGAAVHATGHYPHTRGQVGDWWWKDVQGYYTAHTNGPNRPDDHFNVFCSDPNSLGGIRLQIGVQGTQAGDHRMTLAFDNGKKIDVIASYGSVSAKSAAGRRIIADIMSQLRSAGSLVVTKAGSPPTQFSLRGSSDVLKRCP